MDLRDFFEDNGIEYWTEGKNVGKGWVNIQCPFCDDSSNHLGIRKKDLAVNCWKCGHHSIINLIMSLTGCKYYEAKELLPSLSLGGGAKTNPPYKKTVSETVSLPRESTKHFPKLHSNYLRKRGFPPLKTIRKYKLRACYTLGIYKFRIIIPIYMDHRLVSFTARDVTDRQDPPYKHLSKEKSVIPPKEAIFNYDTVVRGGDLIICEGPLDAMKMGDGAICIFGAKPTVRQTISLKKKQVRKCFVFTDNDKTGKRAGKAIAHIMAPLCKEVEIVELLKHNDPGQLTLTEAASIRDTLGFNL